jgi:hypothetical protein
MLLIKLFNKKDDAAVYTQQWLEKRRIGQKAITISAVSDVKIASLEEFFDKHHLPRGAIATSEAQIKIAEATQRLEARSIILWSLVVPMSVIPFWLMGLLTFNSLGKIKLPENLQSGILVAVVSDYLGLYYVVTQDLFSQGQARSKKPARTAAKDSDAQPEDDESD